MVERNYFDSNLLCMWGCLAKVNIPTPKKRKFGPKTVDCVFLGYSQNIAAYRFFVVKSGSPDVSIYTIMDRMMLHSLGYLSHENNKQ